MDPIAQIHWGIFLDTTSNTAIITKKLLSNTFIPEFKIPKKGQGVLFSRLEVDRLSKEEEQHDHKIIPHTTCPLKEMSSGEQRKTVLKYLLGQQPAFIVLDNPFDYLDVDAQQELTIILNGWHSKIPIIQLINRERDILPFLTHFITLKENTVTSISSSTSFLSKKKRSPKRNIKTIPGPLVYIENPDPFLVRFKNVSVKYGNKPILNNINWDIGPNEFWQLNGKNGSGKTTLLSMITGDNTKAYGQEVILFGKQKGSGESIWDIKEKIGYFSPSMTTTYSGQHTVEQMLISGLYDSIGLYTLPSDSAVQIAREWLQLLDMVSSKDTAFHQLPMGQQRIILTVRAMIKHPLLLILDEPTVGLDDESAAIFVSLINIIALGSHTSIIFVSHRKEPGLAAKATYTLKAMPNGSTGTVDT